jgi:hypothetical protein
MAEMPQKERTKKCAGINKKKVPEILREMPKSFISFSPIKGACPGGIRPSGIHPTSRQNSSDGRWRRRPGPTGGNGGPPGIRRPVDEKTKN